VDPALRRLTEAGDPSEELGLLVRLESVGASLPEHVRVVSRFGEIVTVRAPRAAIEQLHASEGVLSVKAPRLYRAELVRVEEGAAEISEGDRRRPDGLRATGRGVVVAFADWGLDFRHPAFLREERTRVLALWDQTAPYDESRPNRFGYGKAHSREAIDEALESDDPVAALGYDPAAWDVGGGAHGTATASIAAGSEWIGGVSGVAPDAEIVFVNLADAGGLGHSVTLAEALDFIRETAGDRPWVMNMSLGRHGGPHDGSTLLEQAIDAAIAEQSGGLVVNSGGNYFSSGVHMAARIEDGETLRIPVRLEESMREVHEIDIWYRGVDRLIVGLCAPDGNPSVLARPGADVSMRLGERPVARVVHRLDDPNNGRNEVVIRIEPDAPAGLWQLVIVGASVEDGRVHAWIEREALHPGVQAHFECEDVATTTTTGTICNGLRNVAVGAYDQHDDARPPTPFSSSGDTLDGRRKPDVLAPGERVLVARSRPHGASAEDTPLSTRMSGTSMSAPFVTGTIACLMELTGRVPGGRVRSALHESSDPFDGPERVRVGAGYLNTASTLEAAAGARVPGSRRRRRGSASALATGMPGEANTEIEEAEMTTITAVNGAAPAPASASDPSQPVEPDDVLNSLGLTARELFEIYVLQRRAGERERLSGRIEQIAGPGDGAGDDLRAGDLLIRGTMGEGVAILSVLVTGHLLDLRAARDEELEPEGRLSGRYAWVIEGGAQPHPREDRFARRVTDRLGYLPSDTAMLRVSPQALVSAPAQAPAPEWFAEAIDRSSRDYIRWYQQALNGIEGAGLAVDGLVGPLTGAAVRHYQAHKGLAVDGIVGPNTEASLIADGAVAPPGSPAAPIPPRPPVIPPVPPASLADLERRYFPPLGTSDAAPFSRSSSIEPIVDGSDYFAQIKATIDSLSPGDAWYVMSWWLEPGFRFAGGDLVGDLLLAKAAAGVDVRVIVWGNRQMIDHPTLAGALGGGAYQRVVRGNIAAAEDLRGRTTAAGGRPLSGRVLIDWSGNAASSHHMKISIFSRARDLIGFIGGIDYLQNRLDAPMHRPPSTTGWHDAGARLRGDAAERVLSTFITRWTEASTLSAATYDIGSGVKPYNPPPIAALTPPPTSTLPPSLDTSVEVIRSIMDSKEFGLVRNRPWSTLPRTGVHEIKRTFQRALGAAQRYIYIEDQAFTAEDSLFPALVAACRRGVKVIAVLPGAGDFDTPGAPPRSLSAEVIRGILGHLNPAEQLNLAVWQLAGIVVHSKLFLIDDEMLEVGSANFMDRSMQFTSQGDDSECTVAAVSSGRLVSDLRVRLWAEHLRVTGAGERAELRDLSRSLGFWRPSWGRGLSFAHPESRLVFVGPSAGGTHGGSGGTPTGSGAGGSASEGIPRDG
jgi:phosphatidylserine/phosphatidylglycerophosphate/cardiolipin synthase-like enzyme/subtilisin family serine protease